MSNRRNYYKCSNAELSMLKKNGEDTDGGREKELNCGESLHSAQIHLLKDHICSGKPH